MPIEETTTSQIPWLFQAVVTSLITLALSLLAAYLIYLYKQKVIASVEIVVNTRLDPNTLVPFPDRFVNAGKLPLTLDS